jgi:hypothetical protein
MESWNQCDGRGHMPADAQTITWTCYRCGAAGEISLLHNDTLALAEAAIRSGHERRDAKCHARRGIGKVKAIQDGKTIAFSTKHEHP